LHGTELPARSVLRATTDQIGSGSRSGESEDNFRNHAMSFRKSNLQSRRREYLPMNHRRCSRVVRYNPKELGVLAQLAR
jgi:hypothetical protein